VNLAFVQTSFHFDQRGQIFQISSIDTSKTPPLLSLRDLMKDPVPGYFYQEQLSAAPNPNYKKDFFEVEKIIGTKKIKDKTYYLVKFLYYPSKFNEYIPAENFKT
jgi:hypothetical protein